MLIGQQIASLPYSLFATHYWLPGASRCSLLDCLPPFCANNCRPIELNRAFRSSLSELSTECRTAWWWMRQPRLSPECHKASPKAASHMSPCARDCHWTTASACSGRGLGSSWRPSRCDRGRQPVANIALHAPLRQLRSRQFAHFGVYRTGSGSARVHPCWSASG